MSRKTVGGLSRASSLGAMLAIALLYCPQASALTPWDSFGGPYLDQLPSGWARLLYLGIDAHTTINTGIKMGATGVFKLRTVRNEEKKWYKDRHWFGAAVDGETGDDFGVAVLGNGDLGVLKAGAGYVRGTSPDDFGGIVFELFSKHPTVGVAYCNVNIYGGSAKSYNLVNPYVENREMRIGKVYTAVDKSGVSQYVIRFTYSANNNATIQNDFVPCRTSAGEYVFYDVKNGTTVKANKSWNSCGEPKAWCWTYKHNSGTATSLAMMDGTARAMKTAATSNFGRTGYTLSSWNTSSNGSGTRYALGQNATAGGCLTLYAQWTANNYAATFNMNGGSGAVPAVTQTYDAAPKALTTTGTGYTCPQLEGKRFLGFYTAASGGTQLYNYKLKPISTAKWTIAGAAPLYAHWTTGASVTINRVQQRYPWNGKVDVDYTLTGVGASADYTTTLYLTFQLGATSVTKSFKVSANGKFSYTLDDRAFDGKVGSLCVTPKVLEVVIP